MHCQLQLTSASTMALLFVHCHSNINLIYWMNCFVFWLSAPPLVSRDIGVFSLFSWVVLLFATSIFLIASIHYLPLCIFHIIFLIFALCFEHIFRVYTNNKFYRNMAKFAFFFIWIGQDANGEIHVIECYLECSEHRFLFWKTRKIVAFGLFRTFLGVKSRYSRKVGKSSVERTGEW